MNLLNITDPFAAAQNMSVEAADTLSGAFSDFDPSIAAEFGYEVRETATFLGIPLFDPQSVMHLLLNFGFNLLVSLIIVGFFYYRKSHRRDYFFTFMIFSSAMFLLLFVMENVKMQIGFALGLFAIFGMIRYRTETVPVREMTYLFIIIAVSVINGLALNISYAELVLVNLLLIGLIWFLESRSFIKDRSTKLITYDRIDLIVPEKRAELIADIEKRTGIKVEDIEIGSVDFLKDSAFVKVTYRTEPGKRNTVDNLTKAKDFLG